MGVVVFQLRVATPTYATPLMSLHKAKLESSYLGSWLARVRYTLGFGLDYERARVRLG